MRINSLFLVTIFHALTIYLQKINSIFIFTSKEIAFGTEHAYYISYTTYSEKIYFQIYGGIP
jgi:hypothetical protein